MTIEQLKRNRFDVILAENTRDATARIMESIPSNVTVGVANSVTVRQIGILEILENRGNQLIDPISMGYGLIKFDPGSFENLNRQSVDADVVIAGTNAVTGDGKLVNVDGASNRVAGIIWNPGLSIIVISKNKIVKNISEALYRIKNVVTPTLAYR